MAVIEKKTSVTRLLFVWNGGYLRSQVDTIIAIGHKSQLSQDND